MRNTKRLLSFIVALIYVITMMLNITVTPVSAGNQRVSLGYGATFMLFPADYEGVTVDPSTGFKTDGEGTVRTQSGDYARGPYIIENVTRNLNMYYGTTTLKVASNGYVANSTVRSSFNSTHLAFRDAVGSGILYTPAVGLLDGVVTEISIAPKFTDHGTKNLNALVTYDGGKTDLVILKDKNLSSPGLPTTSVLIIGAYANLESVELITTKTDNTYVPPVIFRVVNDHPESEAPDYAYKKYVRPYIKAVTPEANVLPPSKDTESPLSVNEVCSNNESTVTDANGVYSDWIEIYNNSDSDIDITGYGLTDNENKPFKWVFPEGVVPAKGHLLVFASGNDAVYGNEIHTSFSIAKAGETIMLSDPNGGILSVINTPLLKDDETIGRYPDGTDNLKYLTATAGGSNTEESVTASFIEAPVFSTDGGFYDEPVDLNITAPSGTVYYTLDGSIPTTESLKFESPLNIENRTNEPNVLSSILFPTNNFAPTVKIDKATVVRACAIDDQGNSSQVVTNTYFVGLDLAEDYNNLTILSVVTDQDNLFDDETGIFVHYDKEGKEWERDAHLEVFDTDGSPLIDQDVGIRVRGFGSVTLPQKALNFYARGEYGETKFEGEIFPESTSFVDGSVVDEYNSLCARHGSQKYGSIRFMDAMVQYMSKDYGTAWQASRPCVQFINGEFWGTYSFQERVSDDYVEEHYGVPADDVMLIKNHEGTNEIYGDSDRRIQSEFEHWLSNTDFSIQANYEELLQKLDIENMMSYYACNLAMVNGDWGGYNFVLWRSRTINPDNPYQDGKWRFLMYDCDSCYNGVTDPCTKNALDQVYARAVRTNPELKRQFANRICDVYSQVYDPVNSLNTMQYFNDWYSPLYQKMNERWNINLEDLVKSPVNIFTNMSCTKVHFYNVIKEVFGFTGDVTEFNVRTNGKDRGSVKVNGTYPDFSGGKSYSGRYFTDCTQTLTAIPNHGYVFKEWVTEGNTTVSDKYSPTTEVTLSSEGSRVTAVFEVDESIVGSPDNPYVISNADELVQMSENINAGVEADKYYVLANNIDLSSVDFTPIGNEYNKFNGTFDGQSYTISGMNIDTDVQGSGLFGYTGESAVVKNVAVADSSVSGSKNVAAIVGNNGGLIVNCYASAVLSGNSTVGGITGNNKGGTVRSCYSNSEINCLSLESGGGIAGKTESEGLIENCYSLTTPVGKIDGGFICENTAAVSADDIASGEVPYMLNSATFDKMWSMSGNEVVFAGNDNKAIDSKVTFVKNNANDVVIYTYKGATVNVPDENLVWKYNNSVFTSQTPVSGDMVIVEENSVVATPTPVPTPTFPVYTAAPTAVPTPTPVPTATPVPTPKPTISGDLVPWDGSYDTSWFDKSQTTQYIYTAAQLASLSAIERGEVSGLGRGDLDGKTFILGADILLNDIDWDGNSGELKSEPILWRPYQRVNFTLDGNGHTVYGLYISEEMECSNFGMIDELQSRGKITNIVFSNTYINCKSDRYCGIIAGVNRGGEISNVVITNSCLVSNGTKMAGILGENSNSTGLVKNCKVINTKFLGLTGSTLAGIVVKNSETAVIKDCYTAAEIIGRGSSGGITGENNGIIDGCISETTITTPDGYSCGSVGGITATSKQRNGAPCVIKNCYNTGNIIVKSDAQVGGVAGETESGALFENCYVIDCTVSNTNGSVGGLVSWLKNSSIIENCYVDCTVLSSNKPGANFVNRGSDDEDVSYIKNCYSPDNGNPDIRETGKTTLTDCSAFGSDYTLTSSDKLIDALNLWSEGKDGYLSWTENEDNQPVFVTAEPTITNESNIVTIENFIKNGVLLLASYDSDGFLIDIKIIKAVASSYELDTYVKLAENGTVNAILVNDVENIMPICTNAISN